MVLVGYFWDIIWDIYKKSHIEKCILSWKIKKTIDYPTYSKIVKSQNKKHNKK